MQTTTALHALLKALSWTLLHSLWIGLIGAFVAGIIIFATKKNTSSLRYNALTTVLFLFIVITVIVSVNEFQRVFSESNNNDSGSSFSRLNDATQASLITYSTTPYQNLVQKGINFFNTNADYFIGIWFFIFIFKLLRLFFSISKLERIKSGNLITPSDDWLRRLQELKKQLKVNKTVLLFESCLIKIPVTVGYLKPIILFPAGVLMNVSPNHVEAVLLHELAHIRRNDYLVNLVQLVLESIFFFNPCVLWISSLIRKERENCCDDFAISKIDSEKDFLTALLVFQDLAFADLRVAQSFSSSKASLLERVRRIAHSKNSSLNKVEKTSLFFVFAFLSILAISFTKTKFQKNSRGAFSNSKTQIDPTFDTVKQPLSREKETILNSKSTSNTAGSTMLVESNNQENKISTTSVEKANESSRQLTNETRSNPGNETKPFQNLKDTGKIIQIVPVITTRTVIINGDSVLCDTGTPAQAKFAFSRSTPAIASIIGDLKNEGLIKDEGEKYTWLLSNEKLLVNGVLQPEAIHMKILWKYITPIEHINIYYECCR